MFAIYVREFLCAGVVNSDGRVAPIYAKVVDRVMMFWVSEFAHAAAHLASGPDHGPALVHPSLKELDMQSNQNCCAPAKPG